MSNILVFSNWQFLGIFLPVFLCVFYLTSGKNRNAILFLGSLVFYSGGGLFSLILLIALTVINYSIGCAVWDTGEKTRFASVAALDAAVLILCKILALLSSAKVLPFSFALPVGLSFYIFKMIAYQADLYRGEIRRKPSFLQAAAYFSMFPQVTQGPIMRYRDGFAGKLSRRKVTPALFEDGLILLTIGFSMKVLLADRIGILWNEISKIGFESISTPLAWLGAYGYSFQLFYDFWGYSLMAAGIGMMLGFPFVENFAHPYAAGSIGEFYRRWHATLGQWFRDYIYIPLGGSRKGTARTIGNLLIVWAVTGFWHGGTLNYVVWGLVLGLLIVSEKYLLSKNETLSRVVGRIHVLVVIPLTWVIFAIPKLADIGVYFGRLFPVRGSTGVINSGDFVKYLGIYWPFFAASVVLCIPAVYRTILRYRRKPWMTAILTVLFWVSMYFSIHSAGNRFMYFSY